MNNPRFLSDLTKKIMAALPPSIQDAKEEVESHLKNLLQTAFENMDLVTQKEMEAQAKLLRKTREKLEKLNERVAELEAHLKKNKKT